MASPRGLCSWEGAHFPVGCEAPRAEDTEGRGGAGQKPGRLRSPSASACGSPAEACGCQERDCAPSERSGLRGTPPAPTAPASTQHLPLWLPVEPAALELSTSSWLLLLTQLRTGRAKAQPPGQAPASPPSLPHLSTTRARLFPPSPNTQMPQIHQVPILVTLVLVTSPQAR